jgi:two-component system, chemotaxis family, sensor kinase CheA
MNIDLERFRAVFFEEAAEHLVTMEAGLLRLEATPDDRDLLNDIFRSAHSIKGSSGMFGLTDLARFTHAMEGVLDRLRDGALAATPARIDLLLRSADLLRVLVAAARADAAPPPEADELAAELVAEIGAAGLPQPSTVRAEQSVTGMRFRIAMAPAPDFFLSGQDPLLLLRDLAALGELSDVTADLGALPSLAELAPETCYVSWTMTLETVHGESAVRDVFTFVDDICRVTIEVIAETPDALEALPNDPPTRERRQDIADRRAPSGASSSTLRVATEKVDEIINLVGELVISQSMVSQLVATFNPDQLAQLEEAVAAMERSMRDLQERVMAVRMLPVGSVFSRLPRLVRDLAATSGKSVALEMSGEETELDKSVIERIADPLTHLIRNAADHGIEAPDVRRAAGKPEQGTIRLTARHQGGNVVIEIADDGAGLNLARIREKALAHGLLRDGETMTDEHLQSLIFHPGFSTAATVSDISGRGVGMDVVKRNVEALNGTIGIESSAGRGTRFRIKLPLTLAILDGMSLGVGSHVYVLPLLSIIESFRPAPRAVRTIFGQSEVVEVRGESVPLIRLHSVLGVEGAVEDPWRALIVLVEHDGRRFGLMVDELLGQSQVVVKNLEANFRRVEGVMGATILGDGHVALILDVQGITRLAGRQHAASVDDSAAATVR